MATPWTKIVWLIWRKRNIFETVNKFTQPDRDTNIYLPLVGIFGGFFGRVHVYFSWRPDRLTFIFLVWKVTRTRTQLLNGVINFHHETFGYLELSNLNGENEKNGFVRLVEAVFYWIEREKGNKFSIAWHAVAWC